MNKERYIRQTLLDVIGMSGQEKLLEAHVVVVGCGGLGSIAAPYLAGAGVGKLTLVDGDLPHVSNLHRQVFFKTGKSTQTKAHELGDHIEKLNPDIKLEVISKMITKESISNMLFGADVVLECTDNIHAKYLVNDFCAIHKVPMVYGAIHKYDGYLSFFENKTEESIHLRDVFAEPNEDIPSCSEVGVMGTLAGMIGLMQANEAIKYISGAGKCMINTLLTYNILNNEQLKLKLKKTYTSDLKLIFKSNTYVNEKVCAVYEISGRDLFLDRHKYDLISILEDYEHEDIDGNVLKMPLSSFDINNWKPNSEKSTVFYCMSGVRSGALVNSILVQYPQSNIFSLEGGLKSLKENSDKYKA